MNQIFDGARIILCLSFFIYASWSDYKTREVSNRVWAILAPSALALTAFQFLVFAPESLQIFVLSFAVTSVMALALFYAGAFGGADAKALMCLSLALPAYPMHLLQQRWFISPLFPITVFTNGVLLAAVSVFYALFRNLLWKTRTRKGIFEGLEKESAGRKILTLLTGYKVKVSKLEKVAHLYPLEDVYDTETGESKRKLLVFPKDEKREDIVGRLKKAIDERKLENQVWATPGLPMLIFITAGLVIALACGDIVWIILRTLLS